MADLLIPLAISSQLDVTGEERVHAAKYNAVSRASFVPPPGPNIYTTYSGNTLQYSTDEGASFPNNIAGGLSSNIAGTIAAAAGGFLYRFGTGGSGGVRYSSDGTTFASGTTGTTSPHGVLYTGSEWLLYGFTVPLSVATNGFTFASRTFPLVSCKSMARKGASILALCPTVADNLSLSTDTGVTWGTPYNTGTTHVGRRLLATTNYFFLFSESGTLIQRSATGASGSWSTLTSPTANGIYCVAYDSTHNRIVIIDSVGASYYSDNEGTSWVAGGTVPGFSGADVGTQDNFMIFSNNKFLVAYGGSTDDFWRISTSTNSAVWTTVFTSDEFTPITTLAEFLP